MGDHRTELNENVIVGKPLSPRTGTESALSSKREGHNNVHWYAELELYLQSVNECVPDLSTLTWGLWIIGNASEYIIYAYGAACHSKVHLAKHMII